MGVARRHAARDSTEIPTRVLNGQQSSYFMAAASSSSDAPPPPKTSLHEFVLSQHSLFGLCYSRSGPAPVAVGCCGIQIGDLPIRQRIFMFFVGIAVAFCVSMEVTIGELNSFLAFIVTLIIVLPVVSFFKGVLPAMSVTFDEQLPKVQEQFYLRLEEILLLVIFVVWALQAVVKAGDPLIILSALATLLNTMIAVWIAEFFALVWQYFFCACCCSSCLPEQSEFQDALAPAPADSSEGAAAVPTEKDSLV